MAQAPTPHRPNGWGQFFLGFVRTLKRLGYTALGVLVLCALVYPYGVAVALNYVLNQVLNNLLPSVVLIGCVLWAFKILLFKPFASKNKKKGDH